jgi:class 3 adenylate cyclase
VEDVPGGARVTLVVEEPGRHRPSELKQELQKEATKIQMAQLALRRNGVLQGQLKEEVANIKERFWPRLLELSAENEREQVRNLTVVFMDLKGFSQWSDDELSDKLALFRGLVKPILKKWHAGYPNMEGDSLRVTFRNASAGLACACMMRGVLTAAGFEVRTGVELGEVTVVHNEITDISDLEGSSINMAARLEAVAAPGQVLATEKIRHYADHKGLFEFKPVKARLAKSIGSREAGDVVACYAVEMRAQAADLI